MKKIELSKALSYVYPVFLGALLALNYTLFIVPNNFAPSGVNGIAVMVQYKLNFSVAYMSLLINIPLCVFAFFKIDRSFAVKTLLFSVTYSAFYLLLDKIDLERFKYNAQDVDTIYPAIIAGLIMGLCIGLSVKNNSSTGGTDIIAKYVSKIKPDLNFFYVTFALNAVVALASFFVYATEVNGEIVYNYKPVCLCVIYAFISSFVGNRIIAGLKHACKFTIVTDQCDELEHEITHTLQHSATRLHGVGIYQHHDKEVLICIVNNHQIVEFERIIKKYPNTFVYVESVDQTIGNFKRIK